MVDERRFAELNDFERGLAALVPTVGGVDRDRLLFLAGRQSALVSRRYRWAWPASTAVCGLAAAVLAVILCVQGIGQRKPAGALAEHAGQPPRTSVASVFDGADEMPSRWQLALREPSAPAYFRLRRINRVSGVDALAQRPGRQAGLAAPAPPYRVIESRYFTFE